MSATTGSARRLGLTDPADTDDADADLVRMADRLVAAYWERDALESPCWDHSRFRLSAGDQALADALNAECNGLKEAVGKARATTLAGFRSKARVLMLQYAPGDHDEGPSEASDDFLAWTLCHDLLAGPQA